MNDLADPSADQPPTPDVNLEALRRPEPTPDVDVRALARPAPLPEVDAGALRRPATPVGPTKSRRRGVMIALLAVVLVAVAGGGLWWNRQVTANPHLEFSGGLNVYRDPAFTDLSGIVRRDGSRSFDADEVDVTFVPNGPLFAMVGLVNGGAHDVRIEGTRPASMFYWGFDRMSISTDPDGGWNGEWVPFEPFTLRRGESRQVRLEFRLAGCDPVAQDPPGFSVLQELDLRYHVLGFTRTAGASFSGEKIALQASRDCPKPNVD
jgi:hypothetical protein